MKRFLNLELLDDASIHRLLMHAKALESDPHRDALKNRVLGLVFLNPSVRTLSSFQAGMTQLGGGSFVVTPGSGSWGFETRPDVVMDGAFAEHVREAIPVLAGYADVLGIRCFAEGKDLREDLREPVLKEVAAHCPVPLINLESAVNHPCQALADWKTLDDLEVPKDGNFVLSWAYHPRALPLAVPAATAAMAARRGMNVTVLRPDGFELPEELMGAAQQAAQFSGGSVRETSDRTDALEGAHVVYAKSWQSSKHYGQGEAEAQLRAQHRSWCVDESWFQSAKTDARFMHCLPVRREVVVSKALLESERSAVIAQAHNRLHVQKAVLLETMKESSVV